MADLVELFGSWLLNGGSDDPWWPLYLDAAKFIKISGFVAQASYHHACRLGQLCATSRQL